MPYLLQTKASDTNTVNVLSKDNLKEGILRELLVGYGTFHMLEEVDSKNIVIERLRIESAYGEVFQKDTIIEFSRGGIKHRVPVNYFMKLNQYIEFAVEIGFKVPFIIDGKTELRCYAPDGKVTTLYFWIEKSIDKKSDSTDYDAQFKEFIAQDIFCTDFVCLYNPTDTKQRANIIFGANGITVDSDKLSIETNGVGYTVGDKIYFHKALYIKPSSIQLSEPISIHAKSHNPEDSIYLERLGSNWDNVSEAEEEIIIESIESPLMSVDIIAGKNYYLFFNKNKRPSNKVNFLYFEPKQYAKKEFDTKEEIEEEIQIMKDRQKQLEEILQEFDILNY